MKGGEPSFDWAMLVPRIVHPMKVAVVEALLYMRQPLSASQLRHLFGEADDNYLSMISYHVRELAKAGAIEEKGSRQVRGAIEKFYFFPASSPDGKAPR